MAFLPQVRRARMRRFSQELTGTYLGDGRFGSPLGRADDPGDQIPLVSVDDRELGQLCTADHETRLEPPPSGEALGPQEADLLAVGPEYEKSSAQRRAWDSLGSEQLAKQVHLSRPRFLETVELVAVQPRIEVGPVAVQRSSPARARPCRCGSAAEAWASVDWPTRNPKQEVGVGDSAGICLLEDLQLEAHLIGATLSVGIRPRFAVCRGRCRSR